MGHPKVLLETGKNLTVSTRVLGPKGFCRSVLDVEVSIWYYGGVGCSRLSAAAFVSP